MKKWKEEETSPHEEDEGSERRSRFGVLEEKEKIKKKKPKKGIIEEIYTRKKCE